MKKRKIGIATALLATSVLATGLFINKTEAAPIPSFKDVPRTHWAYEPITKASQEGLVEGYNGMFNPNGNVTRQEFATFLARVFDGNERVQHSFSDVSRTHWATDAINEGIALGFIQPDDYTNGRFEPNKAMTRSEIAEWLVNGLVSQNPEYSTVLEELNSDLTILPVTEFLKGGIDEKDVPYLGVIIGTGVMTGYSDYSIKPDGKTSRSEVVAMLFRYQDVLEKEPNSFSELNELREVATTGTNILSLTNFEESEFGGYENVLGKQHSYLNNIGVTTIERAIFVDTTGSKPKGVYKDMFFNEKAQEIYLNRNRYNIYYEYSIIPSKETSLFSISNGSHMHFASLMPVNKDKAKQFGIKTPANSTDIYFKKGQKQLYWAENSAGNEKGETIDGVADDGSQFYYTIPN